MDPALIIAVLAFVAIGGVGVAFAGGGAGAVAQSGRGKKRVKAVANRTSKRKDTGDAAALKRRATTQEALKELSLNEKQSRKRRISIKGQLIQAGIEASLMVYWSCAAACSVVLAIIGWMISQHIIGVAMGAGIGLFGLPRWVLGALIGMRQKKFGTQLADAIDIIVRGVKSGLPLNQCLRIIADESLDPIKSEFKALVDGQAIGVPFEQNLQKLYERMPLPEVNFFVIVLMIQQKTGGNLSESLGNLSAVLRARKMMKAKVNALSSEAKASAMIIGSLPFIVMLVVYIIKPDYMLILFTTNVGKVILLAAAVMMTTGILVMRQMINFKF